METCHQLITNVKSTPAPDSRLEVRLSLYPGTQTHTGMHTHTHTHTRTYRQNGVGGGGDCKQLAKRSHSNAVAFMNTITLMALMTM